MEFTLSSTALHKSVSMISKVLTRKPSLPILSDFHCEVQPGILLLTASDTEVTITDSLVLESNSGVGFFCMDADRIKSALAKLPEQPVTLKVTDDQIVLTHESGNFHFPINNPNPYEYPMPVEMLAPNLPNEFDIDSREVIEAVSRSLWACAVDDLRPVMSGVCFHIENGYLEIVATNGHCIVRNRIKVKAITDQDLKATFVLPKKAALILTQQSKDTEFTIAFDGDHVLINSELTYIFASLLDAKYPNYNSVWPTGTRPTALIYRSKLLNSVSKVSPFASDASNMIRLMFSKDSLVVSSEDYDFQVGATDAFNVEYEGDTIAFGMKSSALQKALQIMKTDKLYMEFKDANTAVTLTYEEPDENNQVDILLMPMLIND